MFRTSYSFVSQSRAHYPDEIGARIWFGNHAPHGTCYAPVYAAVSHIPDSYQRGSLHAFDQDSAWWIFAAVANYAERAYR
jgi:dipeptidase